MTKNKQMSWLQTNTVRVARVHFFYILALASLVIVYDSWKLLTAEALMERWSVAVSALLVVTAVWFLARNTTRSETTYRWLLGVLIMLDVVVAGLGVYQGRGMSSRAVALFAIPLVVSAITLSRSAIFATASVCAAVYSYSAVRYFTDNPSEGYKVELYGDILFYSATFFIIAALLWTLVRSIQPRK